MTSPQDFMLAFAKAIIHNVDTRPQIVQEWTEKLEVREAELGKQFYERFEKELRKWYTCMHASTHEEFESLESNDGPYTELCAEVITADDALQVAKKVAGIE